MTRKDVHEAMELAMNQLRETDGVGICFLAVRVNDQGHPELFTPTVGPELCPTERVIAMVRAYLSFLEQGLARPASDSIDGAPQFTSIEVDRPNPLHTHRPSGHGRGRNRVN